MAGLSLQSFGLVPMDEDIAPEFRRHPSAHDGPSPVNYAVLYV